MVNRRWLPSCQWGESTSFLQPWRNKSSWANYFLHQHHPRLSMNRPKLAGHWWISHSRENHKEVPASWPGLRAQAQLLRHQTYRCQCPGTQRWASVPSFPDLLSLLSKQHGVSLRQIGRAGGGGSCYMLIKTQTNRGRPEEPEENASYGNKCAVSSQARSQKSAF